MRLPRYLFGAVGLLLAAAAPAQSQQSTVSSAHPWAAFFGCWAPVEGARTLAITCVLPVAGSPLEMQQLTVVGSEVVETTVLLADGARRVIDAEGCKGWESAAFSVDGARVYTSGSASCNAGAEQRTSGLLSITPEGEFLHVAAVRVGDQRTVRTQRLELLRWVELPTALQERVGTNRMLADGARTRAARPMDLGTVEEALQAADPFVVEAWMAETGTGGGMFRVTRRDLQRLVAIEAPTRIIDMAVVLANPLEFSPRVERLSNVAGLASAAGSAQRASVGSDMRFHSLCDATRWGMMGGGPGFPYSSFWLYPGMGLSYYSWFPECGGPGMYSRWAYGRNGFGGWYGGPFTGVPATVTVTTAPRGTGTINKGSGYQSNSPGSSTGTARSRPTGGPATVRAGGSNASSSAGGSSEGTRSSGTSSTGRKAQPRNPQQQ